MPLNETQLQQIRKETKTLYPCKKVVDVESLVHNAAMEIRQNVYTSAVTAERERQQGLVEALEQIRDKINTGIYDQVELTELSLIATNSLNQYNQSIDK